MEMIALKATVREPSAKPRALRRNRQVPCIVYGHDVKSLAVCCDEKELHKVFAKAGESTLVELDVAGKKIPVLFKDIAFEPVSSREVHADFYAVNLKEEIETLVPVKFEGEAPAIKELGGIFVVTNEHVTVRCLPTDLPHELVADVSTLAEFHSSVTVKDLKIPKGVKIMDEEDTMLATVQEPRKEEEITPAPTAEAVPAEGAAPAEGAPAAEGAAPAAAPAAAAESKGKK
ncbi:MAG: 50S ribosomal protein L25 [Candidatus Peribacteraceae bacterium]|nr:50S ribosomal protein L25 [Candidatus Peribacteraceae bacterium]